MSMYSCSFFFISGDSLVSSYIADYIVENGKEHLLLEMLDEKYLSTEDVFNTLGISLNEMVLK